MAGQTGLSVLKRAETPPDALTGDLSGNQIAEVLRSLTFRSGIETLVVIDKPAARYLADCIAARCGKA
jgi:hypothetical protein